MSLEIHLVRRGFEQCEHTRVFVSEDLWCLTCKDCGQKIDPIWWIVNWAQKAETEKSQREELIQEIKSLERMKKFKCSKCGEVNTLNPKLNKQQKKDLNDKRFKIN